MTHGRVFAIEAGGTATRAVVRLDGTVLSHTTGSVNPASAAPEQVRWRWAEVLGWVAEVAGRDCAGWIATASIGGTDTVAALDEVRAAALETALCGAVSVSNDVVPLLLGPPLSGSGYVLVAGTGSTCLAAMPGRPAVRGGGHEYVLSDEGSGYQIGLAGLRAALRCVEDTGPATSLAGCRPDLPDYGRYLASSAQAKTEIAAFAAEVIAHWAAGDQVAAGIVDIAVIDLESLVAGCAARLGDAPRRLLACGSLFTRSGSFATMVFDRLLDRWPGLEVLVTADALNQCLALASVGPVALPAGANPAVLSVFTLELEGT